MVRFFLSALVLQCCGWAATVATASYDARASAAPSSENNRLSRTRAAYTWASTLETHEIEENIRKRRHSHWSNSVAYSSFVPTSRRT